MRGNELGVYALWKAGGCCRTGPSAWSSQSQHLHTGIDHEDSALYLEVLGRERITARTGKYGSQFNSTLERAKWSLTKDLVSATIGKEGGEYSRSLLYKSWRIWMIFVWWSSGLSAPVSTMVWYFCRGEVVAVMAGEETSLVKRADLHTFGSLCNHSGNAAHS